MDREFIYKNGKIKASWNTSFLNKTYEANYFSKRIEIKTKQIKKTCNIRIEMELYRGGRICYGMLMARVQPEEKNDIVNLHIAYTKQNTVRYYGSCLLNDKYVYEGLLHEYVDAVCNTAYKVISEKKGFPQCDIFFEQAANCEVGSSSMIFSIIVETIINLIYASSSEELAKITDKEFAEKYVKKLHLYS